MITPSRTKPSRISAGAIELSTGFAMILNWGIRLPIRPRLSCWAAARAAARWVPNLIHCVALYMNTKRNTNQLRGHLDGDWTRVVALLRAVLDEITGRQPALPCAVAEHAGNWVECNVS